MAATSEPPPPELSRAAKIAIAALALLFCAFSVAGYVSEIVGGWRHARGCSAPELKPFPLEP